MSYIERVLVVFNADGTFKGAHAADERGIAAPVTQDGLAAVLPEVGGLMARIETAEAAIAALTQERDAAHAERDAAVSARDALQAQIDAAVEKSRQSVSPLQAKTALLRQGLLDDVEAMIAASPREIQLAWNEALMFGRNSPLINSLGASLGLSSQQIDDLFALAATL